jgi:hypothetical protein
MMCLSPGNWMSESGMIAALHMMQGTIHAMWELYLTQLAKGGVRRVSRDPNTVEFLCADRWCSAFTFGKLADDIAKRAEEPNTQENLDQKTASSQGAAGRDAATPHTDRR